MGKTRLTLSTQKQSIGHWEAKAESSLGGLHSHVNLRENAGVQWAATHLSLYKEGKGRVMGLASSGHSLGGWGGEGISCWNIEADPKGLSHNPNPVLKLLGAVTLQHAKMGQRQRRGRVRQSMLGIPNLQY